MQLHFDLLVICSVIILSLLDYGDAHRRCSRRYTCYKPQQCIKTHYTSCGWLWSRRCTRHVTVDGVLGQHGASLDLVQHRVAIHNKNITKDDFVIILLHDVEEDVVEDLRIGTNTSNVTHITVTVNGVLGPHGESMDLVQHRVGNMDHLAIHNKNITKDDLVKIFIHDIEEDDIEEDDIEEDHMEEDVVQDLQFSTNTSNVTHITVEIKRLTDDF